MVAAVTTTLFILALGYAAVRDLMSYEIPNWVSLAIVVDFAARAGFGGMSLETLGLHLAVGTAALIVGAGLFFKGAIGGGDAKLLAACALWFGWPQFLPFVLLVAIAGGGLAIVVLVLRRAPMPAAWGRARWFGRLIAPDQGLPYGVAIALAGMAAIGQAAPSAGWL